MNSPNKKLKQLSSKQLATLGHKIRTEQHLAFPHEPVAIIGIYDQFSIQDIITKTDLHLNHQTGLFVCSCEKQTIHLKQFQGTCICVQGSILLAAHLACQSLRTAETKICVAADSSNNSIILKRYDDALGDHSQIWSIIRGSIISNGECLFKNDLIDPDQLISNEPYNDIIYSLCPTMSSIRPYFYGIYSKELYGQYLQLILEHPGDKKSRNQKFSSCFLSHIMPFVDTPKVDQSLSMIELGLDSLMMTTLKNQLEKKCAMIIPTHLFNGEVPLYQVISDLEMHIQQKPAMLRSTLEKPKQKDFLANLLQMASTEIPQESLRIEKQMAREVIVNGQKKLILPPVIIWDWIYIQKY
ncbi:MAG: hypothetical protein OMM_00975 [Candidatus Magnetoglobus multicellularis str. Araruama]|uniref:Carrier domain-containing protein n=1 Tax=Candidatus Magnetoglobus multicellularis str. Araruama TaxID=890399 RepID=A0A1V1PET8_9BACT|nr:MAG: hypothetical protein OMM_00975 [Candidatus Magnetoglobus multicellularis str. Araruama]